MREKVPVVLLILTCTVLYHALKEWERNGGEQPWPQKSETVEAGGKKEGYFFNRLHDGGRLKYIQIYFPGPLLMTI
jgi:hypothetical protein